MVKTKKAEKKRLKKANGKITKNMSFAELVQKYPEAAQILFQKGMHCIGCGMASYETIEQGAMVHGIDAEELVKEMNQSIRDKN